MQQIVLLLRCQNCQIEIKLRQSCLVAEAASQSAVLVTSRDQRN